MDSRGAKGRTTFDGSGTRRSFKGASSSRSEPFDQMKEWKEKKQMKKVAAPKRANVLGDRPGAAGRTSSLFSTSSASSNTPANDYFRPRDGTQKLGSSDAASGSVIITSRLCLKNLPAYLTDERLRDVLNGKDRVKGVPAVTITDLKIIRSEDGKSRKFAFVGLASEQEAQAAQKFWNMTFIDTAKLNVEFAQPKGSGNLAAPLSARSKAKHDQLPAGSVSSSASSSLASVSIVTPSSSMSSSSSSSSSRAQIEILHPALVGLTDSQIAKVQKDPRFKEFVALLRGRQAKSNKFWANDDNVEVENTNVQPKRKGARVIDEGEHGEGTGATMNTFEDFIASIKQEKKGGKNGKNMFDSDDEDDDDSDDDAFNNPMLDRDVSAASSGTVREGIAPTKSATAARNVVNRKDSRSLLVEKEDSDEEEFEDGDSTTVKEAGELGKTSKKGTNKGTENRAAVNSSAAKNASVSDMDYFKSKLMQDDRFDDSSDEEREAGGNDVSDNDDEGEKGDGDAATDDEDEECDETISAVKAGSGRLVTQEHIGGHGASGSKAPLMIDVEAEYALMMETGRIYAYNLPFDTTVEDLAAYFGTVGALSETFLPLDKDKRTRGQAFLTFVIPEHAVRCYKQFNGGIFRGRPVKMTAANAKRMSDAEAKNTFSLLSDDEKKKMGHKKRKLMQMQEQAEKTDNWNSLFLRQDTVAEAISKKFGLTKGELMNSDANNVAVRLSVAETHIIAQTKCFLEEHGVDLQAFEGPKEKRVLSKTVVMVKNLPFDTEEAEIRKLFARQGSLTKLVLPPSKATALVEYMHEADAKKAFRALAYKKYRHVPIYLEWAPQNAMKPTKSKASVTAVETEVAASKEGFADAGIKKDNATGSVTKLAKGAVSDTVSATVTTGAQIAASSSEEDPDTVGEVESGTVFVKNLNFLTTEDGLAKAFAACGKLRAVTITKKRNPDEAAVKKGQALAFLSLGYGFVEFVSKDDAVKAAQKMNGHSLDGHDLQTKLSHRQLASAFPSSLSSSSSASSAKTIVNEKKRAQAAKAHGVAEESNKLMVRNIPFEATATEIKELFSTFGKLKRCRLPKKFDGTTRGFAFIDFVTKQEALNAYKSLQNTHLYGRHLVIEWAQPEDTVEEMIKKTGLEYEQKKQGEVVKKRANQPML